MMKGKPMIERSREPLFDDAPRPDAPVSGEPPRRSVLEASARLSRLVRLGTLGFGRPYWRGTIYSASSGALRMKGLDGLSVLARTPWLAASASSADTSIPIHRRSLPFWRPPFPPTSASSCARPRS